MTHSTHSSIGAARWKKYKSNKVAMFGLVVFLLITLLCIFSRQQGNPTRCKSPRQHVAPNLIRAKPMQLGRWQQRRIQINSIGIELE